MPLLRRVCRLLMLWAAPLPALKCHGCVKAPTIRRSQICKRSRQSVAAPARAWAHAPRRVKRSLKMECQMLPRLVFACMTAMAIASSVGFAQAPSPNGVKTLNPPGAIKAEGTWSLGARAGDFVFVAGMQGVDPATNA